MEFRPTPVNWMVLVAMGAYVASALALVAGALAGRGRAGGRAPRVLWAPGWALYVAGFAVSLAAWIVRWHEVQHAPLQNLYEVFLTMGVLMLPISLFCRRALRVGAEWADAVLAAVVLFPVAMVFNPDPQHLPAALQSPLFVPHVAVYLLSYVILAKATVQALACAGYRSRWAILVLTVPRAAFAILLMRMPPVEVALLISGKWLGLGWLFAPCTTGLYFIGAKWEDWVLLMIAAGAVLDVGLNGLAGYLVATGKALPHAVRFARERATYTMVCLGFPLLTLGLVLGATWGKLAWGDYWNWDPKELWSLVSWLVFLGYLHFRAVCGPRWARVGAVLVCLGFVCILTTLLWANLSPLFAGLHSYA